MGRALRLIMLAMLVAVVAVIAAGVVLISESSAPDGDAPESGDPFDGGTFAQSARKPCRRPYSARSPWNTPIGRRPAYHPRSAFHVSALDGELTSDPTQYTYPVYEVTRKTTRETVRFSGLFSNVIAGDRALRSLDDDAEVRLPIPPGADAAEGSDAQIIVRDRATGDEWGAWQLRHEDDGWQATNGYHYDTDWDGVPPRGFGSRGAGVPYLAGLVRPCEIARRHIRHALAFAYDYPTEEYVYPATKSDGSSTDPADMPEGSRLQLDPSISRRRIRAWGCTGPCLTMARALQRYGMYVIDQSGRPKVMLEYEGTAHWGDVIDDDTVSPIPFSAFRLLKAPGGPAGSGFDG